MGMINYTSDIGLAIANMTNLTTGSLFLTLLIITFCLIMAGMALGMPIELTIPIIFPMLIASAVVTTDFFAPLAVTCIYLAILFVRNLFIT